MKDPMDKCEALDIIFAAWAECLNCSKSGTDIYQSASLVLASASYHLKHGFRAKSLGESSVDLFFKKLDAMNKMERSDA